MGLTDILNTARDALAAQTFGLTVTGQNVANVNTPGYTRRRANLETLALGDQNFGSIRIAGLTRVADEFVNQRHLSLTGLGSHAFTRDQLLASTEAVFNDFDGTGFGSDLSALFSSFSGLASRPGDITTRSVVLERGDVLATRIREASDRVTNQRAEIFSQARDLTSVINDKIDSIAELSGRINLAKAGGANPADLEDRRDALLLDLTEMVEVRTYTDGNGQLVVQGPGVTLIQGDSARHLLVDLDNEGELTILAQTSSGAGSNVTGHLSGGSLAALVQVRDSDLTTVLSELDTFAFELAGAVNSVHGAGFALDGSAGQDFFTSPVAVAGAAANFQMNADLLGNPELLAASGDPGAVPGDSTVAVLLAQVAETPIAGLGGRTPSEGYAHLVGTVGQLKSNAAKSLEIRSAMAAQVEVTRQSISGVSLDEEMVSLTKYQRAFEAASRVLTTADRLLEELINTLGR